MSDLLFCRVPATVNSKRILPTVTAAIFVAKTFEHRSPHFRPIYHITYALQCIISIYYVLLCAWCTTYIVHVITAHLRLLYCLSALHHLFAIICYLLPMCYPHYMRYTTYVTLAYNICVPQPQGGGVIRAIYAVESMPEPYPLGVES